MWYEILPTFAILVAGIAFTPICSVYMNKLVQKGNVGIYLCIEIIHEDI